MVLGPMIQSTFRQSMIITGEGVFGGGYLQTYLHSPLFIRRFKVPFSGDCQRVPSVCNLYGIALLLRQGIGYDRAFLVDVECRPHGVGQHRGNARVGGSGIGGLWFCIIAVPLLVLLDTAYAPGPTLLASLLLAVIMTRRGRHRHQFQPFAHGIIRAFDRCRDRGLALTHDPNHTAYLFGGIILLAVGLSLTGLKVPVTSASLLGIAAVAGVMGTMAGIHGPPLALLYQRENADKVRAMLAVFFLIGYSLSLLALGWTQLFRMRELTLGCSLMPGVVIGYILSRLLKDVFKNTSLHGPILFVATLSALALLLKG